MNKSEQQVLQVLTRFFKGGFSGYDDEFELDDDFVSVLNFIKKYMKENPNKNYYHPLSQRKLVKALTEFLYDIYGCEMSQDGIEILDFLNGQFKQFRKNYFNELMENDKDFREMVMRRTAN